MRCSKVEMAFIAYQDASLAVHKLDNEALVATKLAAQAHDTADTAWKEYEAALKTQEKKK